MWPLNLWLLILMCSRTTEIFLCISVKVFSTHSVPFKAVLVWVHLNISRLCFGFGACSKMSMKKATVLKTTELIQYLNQINTCTEELIDLIMIHIRVKAWCVYVCVLQLIFLLLFEKSSVLRTSEKEKQVYCAWKISTSACFLRLILFSYIYKKCLYVLLKCDFFYASNGFMVPLLHIAVSCSYKVSLDLK